MRGSDDLAGYDRSPGLFRSYGVVFVALLLLLVKLAPVHAVGELPTELSKLTRADPPPGKAINPPALFARITLLRFSLT